jgi:hypothetical protein
MAPAGEPDDPSTRAIISSSEAYGGTPAESPPRPPEVPGRPGEPERDDESVSIVFEMVKTATDLQFKIAERVDSKVRAYFGFGATVYTVAQAIVLKSDVHEKLGSKAGTVQGLAIAATVLLVLALACTLNALRAVDEEDVSEAKLAHLLERGYTGDQKTGADGVNLMIGQLHRRKATNETRTTRLTFVIWTVGLTALVAFVQVAVAVETVA